MKHNKFVSFWLFNENNWTLTTWTNCECAKQNIINSSLCFKKRSKQTNLRNSFDSQTTFFFNVYHLLITKMIRLNHQIRFKSSIKHYIKYQNKNRIRNFVIRSEIRFSIINIRNILLVRKQTRIHINWFLSIHFTFQYFEWI